MGWGVGGRSGAAQQQSAPAVSGSTRRRASTAPRPHATAEAGASAGEPQHRPLARERERGGGTRRHTTNMHGQARKEGVCRHAAQGAERRARACAVERGPLGAQRARRQRSHKQQEQPACQERGKCLGLPAYGLGGARGKHHAGTGPGACQGRLGCMWEGGLSCLQMARRGHCSRAVPGRHRTVAAAAHGARRRRSIPKCGGCDACHGAGARGVNVCERESTRPTGVARL